MFLTLTPFHRLCPEMIQCVSIHWTDFVWTDVYSRLISDLFSLNATNSRRSSEAVYNVNISDLLRVKGLRLRLRVNSLKVS